MPIKERKREYVSEARNVWTKYWRQRIPRGVVIHHLDKNRENNDITNLVAVESYRHQKLFHKDTERYFRKNSKYYRTYGVTISKLSDVLEISEPTIRDLLNKPRQVFSALEKLEKLEEKYGSGRKIN